MWRVSAMMRLLGLAAYAVGSSARQAARQARERRRTAGAGDPIDVRRTTVEDSLDGSPR